MEEDQIRSQRLDEWINAIERRFGRIVLLLAVVGCVTLLSVFCAFPVQIYKAFFAQLSDFSPNQRFVRTFMPLSIDPWHTKFTTPQFQAFRHRLLGPVIAWSLGLRGR